MGLSITLPLPWLSDPPRMDEEQKKTTRKNFLSSLCGLFRSMIARMFVFPRISWEHNMLESPSAPRDVIGLIISFVPYAGSSWLHCRLVSKDFLALCKKFQEIWRLPFDPLGRMIEKHNVLAVRSLLGDESFIPEEYCILVAIRTGNIEIVRLLLDYARVNMLHPAYEGNAACALAFCYGAKEIARLLLQDPRTIIYDRGVHYIHKKYCVPDCVGFPEAPLKKASLWKDDELLRLIQSHTNFCPFAWETVWPWSELAVAEVIRIADWVRTGRGVEDLQRKTTGDVHDYEKEAAKIVFNFALRACADGYDHHARSLIEISRISIPREAKSYILGLLEM